MPVDHYENFPVASWVMPARLRRPVELVYAFARSADDIADEGDAPAEERLRALGAYRAELDRIDAGQPALTPLFRDLAPMIAAHRLPVGLFRDLLDAFAQDVVKTRYASFDEVLDYSRRSADPVGRLLLHLFERTEPPMPAWSDSICSALQLINFLQDVAIDWQKGRVYLAQDELAAAGLDESWIAEGRVDDRWRAFMSAQVGRAGAMLESGAPLARALPGRVGLELRMIVSGGLRIVQRLQRARGDVFRQRPVLGTTDWIAIVGRTLWFPAAGPRKALATGTGGMR
ncbi:MAG: squalene synthase HpnC [Burkholderiales bacterium]|nr:squalene synthase HpnC [Burkholderiales bacterium]